jgi:hypothetical protein
MSERMAKEQAFNLSAAIRGYQSSHPGISGNDALDAVKKAHSGQTINEGTFRSTFYKLSGRKRKRTGQETSARSRGGQRQSCGGQAHRAALEQAHRAQAPPAIDLR